MAVMDSVYVMTDPYRVIIDLPEVSFQLPPGSGSDGFGLVTQYRFGIIGEGKSRVVFWPGADLRHRADAAGRA